MRQEADDAGDVDYEWQAFRFFHSSEDVANALRYWGRDAFFDVGSDTAIVIPEDYSPGEKHSSHQFLQLTAGAIAGAFSRSCTAPIDRLKVMRQVHGYKHKGSNFLDAYRYMIREGGFFSMWRGNGISVIKIAPETALKYGSYEHYKRILTNADNNDCWLTNLFHGRPLLAKFLAGSLAGSTAQTVIYPFEVLKTRMCLRKTGQFQSALDCARAIYKDNGVLAFYRGYFINLLGIVPYAGIELALYEYCKATYIQYFVEKSEALTDNRPTAVATTFHHPPTHVVPVLAAFASACGIVATYPISLIRAKLQATIYSQSTGRKVTVHNLLHTILRQDGFTGLYRGMWTNLIKVLPAVGISLTSYEVLRREFHLGPLGSG